MITLTITAETAADLNTQLRTLFEVSQLAKLVEATSTPTSTAAINGSGEAQEEAETSTPPKAASSKKTAPAGSGKQGSTKPKADKESVLDKKLDRSDVRAALTNFLALNDEPATAALLKKHGGVEKLSELSEDRFQAVYDAANA